MIATPGPAESELLPPSSSAPQAASPREAGQGAAAATSVDSRFAFVTALVDDPRLSWSVSVRELPQRSRVLGQVGDGTPVGLLDVRATTPGAAPGADRLLLLVEVAVGLVAGRLSRAERITPEEGPAPVGLLRRFSGEDSWSIPDLAVLVGALGDPWAQKALMARVGGQEALRRRAEVLSLPMGDDCAVSSDHLSRLLVDVDRGIASTPAVCALVREWAGAGVDLSMVAGGLGLDPLARGPHSDPALWHVTGVRDGARLDAGVVHGPRATVVYSVQVGPSAGSSAQPASDLDHDARLAMQRIGAAVRAVVL